MKDVEGNIFCTDFFLKFSRQLVDCVPSTHVKESAVEAEDGDEKDASNGIEGTTGNNGEVVVNLEAVAASAMVEGFQPRESHLITITCNDKLCTDVVAFIAPNGHVYFHDDELNIVARTPSTKKLQSFDLQPGANLVISRHAASNTSIAFTIWLYDLHENLVIMDIDGTITKSDITGYIQTYVDYFQTA